MSISNLEQQAIAERAERLLREANGLKLMKRMSTLSRDLDNNWCECFFAGLRWTGAGFLMIERWLFAVLSMLAGAILAISLIIELFHDWRVALQIAIYWTVLDFVLAVVSANMAVHYREKAIYELELLRQKKN